jgi:hypothetical protein
VPADKPKKSNPFEPQALLEAQRRNFEAFTSAGQIVADGMRTYAERQIAMVQDAMSGLWTELQASMAQRPSAQPAAVPAEHLERMRAAFERVVAQVHELGNLLLKVHAEAIAVLNECAAKNFQSLGGTAPELAALQKKAKEAFEAASRQTTAVVDEMKKRMASLEEETRKAATAAPSPSPKAPAPKPASAATERPNEAPAPTRARRATAGKGGAKS